MDEALPSRHDNPGPSRTRHPTVDDQVESQTLPMRPGIDRINLEWKTNEFMPDRRVRNERLYTYYKSSIKQYKGLEWYIIWVPRKPKSLRRRKEKFPRWKLKVQNTTSTLLDAYVWLELYSYSNMGLEHTKRKTRVVEMLNISSGEQMTVFSWEGEGMNNVFGRVVVNLIKASIEFLHKHEGDNCGRFTLESKTIISAMKEEARVVQVLQKWLKLDASNYNFWIESSTGSKIGFHKQILEQRGGDVINAMLSSGMLEPQNELMKIENVDEQIIQGFKSYLYGEQIPNFANNAYEYFKFAAQYQLIQLKDLAELEICKMLDPGDLMEAHKIANYYPTKYLKEEIITLLSEYSETVIRNNFHVLEDLQNDLSS